MSWDQFAQGGIVDLNGDFSATMRKMRDSLALRRLPFEAVEEGFRRMKKIEVRCGDEVVKQGDPGDAFYLILEGQAEVWQQGIYDDEQKQVATLGPGDSFGEEALVLKGTRNATVRMSSKGRLLSLAKSDFEELVATTTIETVKPEVAKSMINNGSKVLDVRYEEEFEEGFLPGSIHIPLPELRERIGELAANDHYVILCAGGKRASVANLLLRQRNFRAATIEGGIHAWPFEMASAE
jgi:rhodanese-related sulfurtransferase